jgi:hypothetical protein
MGGDFATQKGGFFIMSRVNYVMTLVCVLAMTAVSCASTGTEDKKAVDPTDPLRLEDKKAIDPTDPLRFDPTTGFTEASMTFLDGKTLTYRAYENIYYVANVADPEYQFLNIYVPEVSYDDKGAMPIFFKTNVGGYMASKASSSRMVTDASGRALQEGYVVVISGSRGWDSKVAQDGVEVSTGRAPNGLVDLKAAIRYLRHNDDVIPGNAERIITDGTSAGGAMSALLGATGNNPVYEPYLTALGAAKERDDVFAAVCFCPIIDLEHADIAYEWLYNSTNAKLRALSPAQAALSDELAALYPAYIDNLKLQKPDGTPLTSTNYLNYLKSFLLQSAQRAKDNGADIPLTIGFNLNLDWQRQPGNFVLDVDLETYLDYIVSKQPLKTPPAFDQLGVSVAEPSAENRVFGDETGNAVNFTAFSAEKSGLAIAPGVVDKVHLLNPMDFIGDGVSSTTQNWYVRHGAIDRDTAFPIPINLYTKLFNFGYHVDFAITWNRGHEGDYDLNGLFAWIDSALKVADKK